MFGVGLPELALLALVAVMVLGPDRLPELTRQAARMLRQVKRLAEGTRDDLRTHLGPEYADLELRDLDPRTVVRQHMAEAMREDPEADVTDADTVGDHAGEGPATRPDDQPDDEPDDEPDIWHDERWETERWGDPEPEPVTDPRAAAG